MKYILSLVLFTFLICSCDKNTEIAPQDEIIRIEFESDTTNLKADNNSIISMKVIIPENSITSARSINFISSSPDAGTFQGTSSDNKNILQVGDDGIGRINFKVGIVPGTYFIAATTSGNSITYKSKDYQIKLKDIPGSDKISLKSSNNNPEADGYTVFNIAIKRTVITDKTAILAVNLGTFLQSSNPKSLNLTFDPDGNATAQYRISNEIVPHIFTLTLANNYSSTIAITPLTSYPEILSLESDALLIDTAGGSIKLTCYLLKNNTNKKVSKGMQVNYKAYQIISGNKLNVGRFTGTSNAISDENGKVPQVSFYGDTGNIDKSKDVIIEVSTNSSTNILTAAQIIRIKK